ncbi:Ribosomal protein L34 [Penicillium expansum]|nr:Ribosomal protein L34 [Penicillium expansum]
MLTLKINPIPSSIYPTKLTGRQNVLPPRQGRALNLPGHHIGHANPDEQIRSNPATTKHTLHNALIPILLLLLSTPTRFQPSRTLGARLSSPTTTATASAFSPLSSLLSQKAPSQSRSFSASASLGVRRVTFRPSRRVQKRRHGYLARKKDRNGRKTLIRRTLKGRKELSW